MVVDTPGGLAAPGTPRLDAGGLRPEPRPPRLRLRAALRALARAAAAFGPPSSGRCCAAPGGLRPPFCALRAASCAGGLWPPSRRRSGAARPPLRRPARPPPFPLGRLCAASRLRGLSLRPPARRSPSLRSGSPWRSPLAAVRASSCASGSAGGPPGPLARRAAPARGAWGPLARPFPSRPPGLSARSLARPCFALPSGCCGSGGLGWRARLSSLGLPSCCVGCPCRPPAPAAPSGASRGAQGRLRLTVRKLSTADPAPFFVRPRKWSGRLRRGRAVARVAHTYSERAQGPFSLPGPLVAPPSSEAVQRPSLGKTGGWRSPPLLGCCRRLPCDPASGLSHLLAPAVRRLRFAPATSRLHSSMDSTRCVW